MWIEPDEIPEERQELWDLLLQRQHTNWERFRHHRSRYPVTARRQIEKLAKDVNKAIRRAPTGRKAAGVSSKLVAQDAPRAKRKTESTGRRASVEPTPTPAGGEADSLLAELRQESTTHRRRLEIGIRLAEIGDPRPGVGVIDGVPDILWRPIPGGDVEIEDYGRFEVEPFRIAAYPVTNAQFEAFLEAEDGYENRQWWDGLSTSKKHRSPVEPRWSEANHPRERVSWYEATAFCRWLGRRLNLDVRLPDEQEWQWAAQSAEGRYAYPWGMQKRSAVANTRDAGLRRTMAVGCFPGGDSEQGVSDLAGNIWEWCRTEYWSPQNTGEGGMEPRVVRGGSWASQPGKARADGRSYNLPNTRSAYVGLRVHCSIR